MERKGYITQELTLLIKMKEIDISDMKGYESDESILENIIEERRVG